MAKAVFHKGQRVYVKPVATWAVVENVNPQWVKGVEEPLRVTYDAGLGPRLPGARTGRRRDGAAQAGPDRDGKLAHPARGEPPLRRMRAIRAIPIPGTYPVVVTDEKDWGGWRVPMAEYDRDPHAHRAPVARDRQRAPPDAGGARADRVRAGLPARNAGANCRNWRSRRKWCWRRSITIRRRRPNAASSQLNKRGIDFQRRAAHVRPSLEA